MKIYKNIHEVTPERIEKNLIYYAKVDEYIQSGFLLWKKESYLRTLEIVNIEGDWYFMDIFSEKCPGTIYYLYLNYITTLNKENRENNIKFVINQLKLKGNR